MAGEEFLEAVRRGDLSTARRLMLLQPLLGEPAPPPADPPAAVTAEASEPAVPGPAGAAGLPALGTPDAASGGAVV